MQNEKPGAAAGKRISLPQPSHRDLMGKQSVRATFKLSEACIAALQIVSTHLRIKQKSLFDHLMQDTDSLRSIARELGNRIPDRGNRIQKTFVVSRGALSSLDNISKDFSASRDALIEYSVRRLLPIISEERRKHGQHKKLVLKIESHYRKGEEILDLIRSSVGPDDPVAQRFEAVLGGYGNMLREMRGLIEKGSAIEEFKEENFG
jgi:hypothetical protein